MITYTSSLNGKQVGQWNADENGMDAYFRISKEYNSGISIGYNFSYENYETFESRTFSKIRRRNFCEEYAIYRKGFLPYNQYRAPILIKTFLKMVIHYIYIL